MHRSCNYGCLAPSALVLTLAKHKQSNNVSSDIATGQELLILS